jgi:hypothetical protein
MNAQTLIYQYDDSGNRIKRSIGTVTKSLQSDTTLNKTADSIDIFEYRPHQRR